MWLTDFCIQQRGQRCIFCDIAADESHPRVVYRDDLVVAFDDINPASSVHILVRLHSFVWSCRCFLANTPVGVRLFTMFFQVIPREHIRDVSALADSALCEWHRCLQ